MLSTADSLVGGDGIDVLNAFTDGGVVNEAQLTSIETINFYDLDDDQDLSSNNSASLTTVNLFRGMARPTSLLGAPSPLLA